MKVTNYLKAALILAVACLAPVAVHAQLATCGPVILAGHDADDHGFEGIYAGLFDELFSNVTNGGSGILAIGVDPGSPAGDWIQTVASLMTTPQSVTYANDAAIDTVSFTGFAILHVGSDDLDVGGGISFNENTRLGARALDVANHVNAGGGLFGLTQGEFSNGWLYVSLVLPIETLDVPPSGQLPSLDNLSNVSATPEGQLLGITDTNLDGCCFHNVFTKFPSQMKVLAFAEAPRDPDYHHEAIFIGGTETCLAPFCGDGKLDPGEQCDDGNQVNGDGCDATCRTELGANQPPIVACLPCESCTAPGLCEIAGSCSSIAVCVDPDKDVVTMSCAPGGPYGLGGTAVEVTCSDGVLSTKATCQVLVRDCEPPVCQPPAPLLLECSSRCGTPSSDPAVQAWLASASGQDNCSVNPATSLQPAAMLPAACGAGMSTPVSFSVTDGAGYQAGCASQILVRDSLPPAVVPPPPLEIECSSSLDLPVSSPVIQAWLAQARGSDICSEVTLTHDAPATFPTGCGVGGAVTTVTFTVTDACGFAVSASSTVTVKDTTPPAIGCTLPELCLWPPNHKYVCFDNLRSLVSITDACDDAPTIAAIECESDQCDDAPCAAHPGENGDGHTVNDCLYDAAADRLCVRAERAGTEPGGRHYSVSYVAVDRCGNESKGVGLRFYVPHDQSPHVGCISAPPGASE